MKHVIPGDLVVSIHTDLEGTGLVLSIDEDKDEMVPRGAVSYTHLRAHET